MHSLETKTYCRSHDHCHNNYCLFRRCTKAKWTGELGRGPHFRVPFPIVRYNARERCVSAVWGDLLMILVSAFLFLGPSLSSNVYKLISVLWQFCHAWDISYHVLISRNNKEPHIHCISFFFLISFCIALLAVLGLGFLFLLTVGWLTEVFSLCCLLTFCKAARGPSCRPASHRGRKNYNFIYTS